MFMMDENCIRAQIIYWYYFLCLYRVKWMIKMKKEQNDDDGDVILVYLFRVNPFQIGWMCVYISHGAREGGFWIRRKHVVKIQE